MKLGPYAVTVEGVPSMMLNFMDALRLRARGVPRLPGDTPVEIAKEVLKRNARKVLHAGSGHFWFMWVSDFAKALRGAEKVLSPSYLRGLIEYMIRESFRQGRVTSCYSHLHGFDMPYYRGDNLPWLFYAVAEYCRWVGDKRLLEENETALQWLLGEYERTHFKNGLIDPAITGDWMDTVLRPSSTYNNVCALEMLHIARHLGLKVKTDAKAFEARILEDRWRGDHFTDYDGCEDLSVDAGVLALYFQLFDSAKREAIIKNFEASALVEPMPIKVAPRDYDKKLLPAISRLTPKYHSSVWIHLGLMYLNGLKKSGRTFSAHKAKIEALIMKHGQMLEAIDERGEPYQTFFHGSEHGLSMAAGQYLELVLD